MSAIFNVNEEFASGADNSTVVIVFFVLLLFKLSVLSNATLWSAAAVVSIARYS